MTRVVKNVQKTSGVDKKGDSKCPKEPKTPLSASEKAGSVHDLRRCAVSSLLRVPPQYTTFNERPRPRLPLQVNKAFKDFSSNSKGQKIWKENFGVCPQFFLKKRLKFAYFLPYLASKKQLNQKSERILFCLITSTYSYVLNSNVRLFF